MNKRQWKKTRCAVTYMGYTVCCDSYVPIKERDANKERNKIECERLFDERIDGMASDYMAIANMSAMMLPYLCYAGRIVPEGLHLEP